MFTNVYSVPCLFLFNREKLVFVTKSKFSLHKGARICPLSNSKIAIPRIKVKAKINFYAPEFLIS